MPRPQYILCAEHLLFDPSSGLVTHVNVLEAISVVRGEDKPRLRAALAVGAKELSSVVKWIVTAVWMREDTDSPEDVFEMQLLLHSPSRPEPLTIHSGEMQFLTVFHRLDAVFTGTLKSESGMLRLESKLRRQGSSDEWLSQEYLIPLELMQVHAESVE